MKRYFVENLTQLLENSQNQQIQIENELFRYMILVMRQRLADEVILFDSQTKISAKITKIDKRFCILEKITDVARLEASNCKIHLGQVILTSEKMDFCIQKATELGVSEITPLYAENFSQKLDANRTAKKQEHWQKIILSSCEQSGNDAIPKLNVPQNIISWIENCADSLNLEDSKDSQTGAKLFLDFNSQNWQSFVEKNQNLTQISVLIGSAGGLSASEIKLLEQHKWQSLNLGKRILRGETASLAILTLIQSQWGDLKL